MLLTFPLGETFSSSVLSSMHEGGNASGATRKESNGDDEDDDELGSDSSSSDCSGTATSDSGSERSLVLGSWRGRDISTSWQSTGISSTDSVQSMQSAFKVWYTCIGITRLERAL